MARERVQTRCDPATVDSIEDHADDLDESRSEAVRQLIRAGLAERGYNIAVADGVGTGQLDELAGQLGKVEQQQAELAEMHRSLAERREQRIKRQWLTTASIAVLFVAVSQLGTAPSALVASGGVIVLAAVMLSTYRAATLTGDDDE